MKILIKRDKGNILTVRDLTDIADRGEIAHIICELELLKLELLEKWEAYNETD